MNDPPIRLAIDGTLETIRARATAYRNLVVFVSLTCVASLLWLSIIRQLVTLTLLSMMLPAVAFWLYQDSRIIFRWCQNTIELCRQAKVDTEVFRNVVTSLRPLPQSTISSMLVELDENERTEYGRSHSQTRLYWNIFCVSLLGSLTQIAGWLTGWALLLGVGIAIWFASIWAGRLISKRPR